MYSECIYTSYELWLCAHTCECVLFYSSDRCTLCLCLAGFCGGECDLLWASVEPCRWWRHRLCHTARQPQNQEVSFCTAFSLDGYLPDTVCGYSLTSLIRTICRTFDIKDPKVGLQLSFLTKPQLSSAVITLIPLHIALKKAHKFF